MSNLESIYIVYGSDAASINEKLIAIIGPLIRSENNAGLHRAEEKHNPDR